MPTHGVLEEREWCQVCVQPWSTLGKRMMSSVWLQGFLVFTVKGFQGKSLCLCVNDVLWYLFFLKESLCFASLHRFKPYNLLGIPLPFQAIPLIKYINVFFWTVILSFRLLASTLCWQLDLRIGYLTYPQNQQLLLECIVHMVLQCMQIHIQFNRYVYFTCYQTF